MIPEKKKDPPYQERPWLFDISRHVAVAANKHTGLPLDLP